jgi:hypothetical protein
MAKEEPIASNAATSRQVTRVMFALLVLVVAGSVVWFVLARPEPPTPFGPSWKCQHVPEAEDICARDPGPVLRH